MFRQIMEGARRKSFVAYSRAKRDFHDAERKGEDGDLDRMQLTRSRWLSILRYEARRYKDFRFLEGTA
jgi:hypothetical protein